MARAFELPGLDLWEEILIGRSGHAVTLLWIDRDEVRSEDDRGEGEGEIDARAPWE